MHIHCMPQALWLQIVFLEATLGLYSLFLEFRVSYKIMDIGIGGLLKVLVYNRLGFDRATAVLAFITLALVPFP